MKKLLLLSALIITSLCVSAQGLKGTWFVGGQLSYSDVKDTKTTMILPIAGTFVSPDVAVGAGLGYQSVKVGDASADDLFIAKPLVRKYWNISGPVYLFGQIAAPMLFGDDYTNVGLEMSPGVDWVVNSWMTIETSFTIFGFNYEKSGDNKDWSIGMKPMNTLTDRKVGDLMVGVKFLF